METLHFPALTYSWCAGGVVGWKYSVHGAEQKPRFCGWMGVLPCSIVLPVSSTC